MEIFTTLTFDAAHRLPKVPAGHKCGNLHGHTFKVEIYVSGATDPDTGWIVDFGDIKKVARPVIEELDHNYLNDIEGLENPTSENLGKWLWARLKPELPGLSKIKVYESPTSAAVYRGEEE